MNTRADGLWARLHEILDDQVPGAVARRIGHLVHEIVEVETAASNKQASDATELMLKDIALQERIMLDAICHGAYDHLRESTEG